ncbi:MAG TPA: hypothetical protein PLD10_25310 [Rhodopila sp.]|nr:hypothetical protein [Rhodopila sp.]
MIGRRAGTWRSVLSLSIADLWGERVLAICTILALAAVMAPLIVLAGLRVGLFEGLRQTLLDNPHSREIVTISNRHFTPAFLQSLRSRQDVAFLGEKTRTLAASLLVEQPGRRGDGIWIELIPTGAGDPLLPEPMWLGPETPPGTVVLSAAAGARLHAEPGQVLVGRLGRTIDGAKQSIELPLRVHAIAPPSSFDRDAAFVPLSLAVFTEKYREPDVVAAIGLEALGVVTSSDFAGFRVYARRLEDVPALDASLRTQGIDVVSHAADVANILRIDRSLGLLFSIVAGLGGSGFMISLGAGFWASVDRKRVHLALLRFLGLSAAALSLLPVLQAVLLALAGASLAVAGAFGVAALINGAFAGVLAIDRPLCVINGPITAGAVLVAIGGAGVVASIAGYRASRVEPWEGVTPP